MAWMEETYAKNSYMEIEEGHMPEEEYEFACDTEILRLLGIPEETGTKVNIQYLTDEGVKEETMTPVSRDLTVSAEALLRMRMWKAS